jgi:hypothetical protein
VDLDFTSGCRAGWSPLSLAQDRPTALEVGLLIGGGGEPLKDAVVVIDESLF